MAFSSDGKTLVSGGADRTVRLWDVDTGTMIARIEGQRGTVSSVAFSPDDALIASASMDSTLALWDRKGRQLHSLVGHTSTVYSAAFSPDGKRLVSAGEDRTIRLWDVETGRETLLLKGHANIALCAAFSPDGQRLASGSHDMTLRLWDANDDREALTLRGHVGMATAVAVSPDDRTIATAGIDGVIKLWDVRLGRVEVVLTGHVQSQPDRFRKANPIRRLAFDAEGRRLFSEDQEGAKRYWDVVTGRALGEQDEADFIVPQGKLSVRVDPSAVHVRSQPTAGDLALLKRWAEPDAAWHEMLGQAAEKEADWFASAFHLRHVVSARKSDASLHIRLAYALARTGDAGSAARHYLQAVLLDPAVRLWPDNPFAWSPAREAAQEGQWQRAGDDYRLAVEQRSPDLATWEGYLLCALAAGRRVEAAEGLRLFLERMTPVTAAKEQYKLVRVGRVVPCGPGEAQKLLAIARSDVAAQRSSSALDFLGAALYRAGQYQPAIDALLESIKLDGDGGYVESWVFLAMAYQRLGNASEARRWLGRYQDWYRRARLDTWPLQTRYRLLHDEASALVETMPRSTDP